MNKQAQAPSNPNSKLHQFWVNWLRPLLLIVIVLSDLRSSLADWNDVPSGSMKPSILIGDRIFVNKLAYDLKVPFTTYHMLQWGDPKRGDVVVFFSPEDSKRLVKRLIGLPDDRISLRNNQLTVNGQPAAYGHADPKIVEQLNEKEKMAYHTAAENIDGKSHPVMMLQEGSSRQTFQTVTVPQGQYFVMGDNRDRSRDSRTIGFVDRKLIVGKATAVVLSFDHDRYYLPRWRRFFTSMP
jgi:signal peptidase I